VNKAYNIGLYEKHKLAANLLRTCYGETGVMDFGLYGAWGTCPLDFQLFNFSGHLRAAQTLTLDSVNCSYLPQNTIQAYNLVTAYNCMNFIIFRCVTRKLFSFIFVPLLARNPGDDIHVMERKLWSNITKCNVFKIPFRSA